jgi:hypothetical protein
MSFISNITRAEGDPRVIRSGHSSLGAADRLGRALGWFSLGLGGLELIAPRVVTRALGLQGGKALVRIYGAREITSGLLALSVDQSLGLWSRVAGDALDIATVAAANRRGNPKRDNVRLALLTLAGVMAIDAAAAASVRVRHARGTSNSRDYRDRSGFPQGVERARGIASARAGG